MLTMSSLALLMITGLEAKVHSETKVEPYHKVHETKMEPYLGSYQVSYVSFVLSMISLIEFKH